MGDRPTDRADLLRGGLGRPRLGVAVSAEVVALLRRGRERIAKGWCQRELAVDTNGRLVFPDSPSACRWCAIGGLVDSVAANDGLENAAVDALSRAIGGLRVSEWQDRPERTQADVLAAYDRAIALAEAQP